MKRRCFKPACAILCLGVALLLLSGCGKKTASVDSDAEVNANVKRGVKPEPDAEVAVLEMENPAYGQMVIELYPNIAPQMVERFKKLIKEGFYNGTTFHRIDPELGIIQGGDPNSKDADPENDGRGDSPYENVPGEFSDVPFDRGIVGAARKGAAPQMGLSEAQARDTANCQFYITLKRVQPFDTSYTIFGRVIKGIGNADVIAGAPTVARRSDPPGERPSYPAERIVIKSITLQPHP